MNTDLVNNTSINSVTESQPNSLEIIEKRLEILLSNELNSWVEIYQLMDKVDKEKLYVGHYRSYTAWVNKLADYNHIHVSTLWKDKKAGKSYDEFKKRVEERGKIVPDLSELNLSPDSLNLITKISGSDTEVADDLINRLVSGEPLTRSTLRNAWATIRANNTTAVRKTRHDADHIYISKSDLTAGDIVLALYSHDWVPDQISNDAYTDNKYKVFTEFAVPTGSTRHARRVDALVLENLSVKTQDKNYQLCIHAIEIKVDRDDLMNDKKMLEYCAFSDYFWIAVPEELEDDAKTLLLDSWGLLVINVDNADASNQPYTSDTSKKETKIRISVAAQKKPGVFRDITLQSALLKLI